ncbi:MAG: hypothetical protein M5U34_13830 [Chloroflexi bacterium]|nr:hypothetical protein [Chloroflexota bacterium]
MSRTTRFNSYWQAATVVTLLLASFLWRKRPPELQAKIAGWGLGVMALGLTCLGLASLFHQVHLLEISLLIFGSGWRFILWRPQPDGGDGLRCGSRRLFRLVVDCYFVVERGLVRFLGGAARDALLFGMGLPPTMVYSLVFALEALGLVGAILILLRIDVIGFARDVGRVVDRADVQMAMLD